MLHELNELNLLIGKSMEDYRNPPPRNFLPASLPCSVGEKYKKTPTLPTASSPGPSVLGGWLAVEQQRRPEIERKKLS